MADDLKYGYKGAEPTQSFGNNTGVFDPNDINNLIADNKWTSFGQLELIETQTASADSSLDFTSIDESTYNVHFLTVDSYKPSNDNIQVKIQFYESGVLNTGTNYQIAFQSCQANGTFSEVKSTTQTSLMAVVNTGNATNETGGGYVYLYNLGDSSKYSFTTFQNSTITNTGVLDTTFGSGVFTQSSLVDGIKVFPLTGTFDCTASLYGIRYS